jgi:hypothetical protein
MKLKTWNKEADVVDVVNVVSDRVWRSRIPATQTGPVNFPIPATQNMVWVDREQLRQQVISWTEQRFMELLDEHGVMVKENGDILGKTDMPKPWMEWDTGMRLLFFLFAANIWNYLSLLFAITLDYDQFR